MDRSPSGGLTDLQQKHLDNLIRAYNERTPRSKAYTQRHRKYFADPRTVAGFRNNWKEMVYPVVVKHSYGSRFWDIDNNEYIDLTMGFGTNLFGHSPDFVVRAIDNQLEHGLEVGPQSPIAGKVASLLCELNGMERTAFASSGSEAVLAAVAWRGRSRAASRLPRRAVIMASTTRCSFAPTWSTACGARADCARHSAAYRRRGARARLRHTRIARSFAGARPRTRGGADRAGAEPPSRSPAVEFLREVRKITAASETALIFDELITGFRSHPGGTQKLWGIEADMATYGKIMGGGLPIGAISARRNI